MAKQTPLTNQEIAELLSKLKDETPNYPEELMEARKYNFIKKINDLQISAEEQSKSNVGGPKWGRGKEAALGSGAVGQGISLNVMIVIGVIVAVLAAIYLFRNQIRDVLGENPTPTAEVISAPLGSPASDGTGTPTPTNATNPSLGSNSNNGAATAIPGSGTGETGGETGGNHLDGNEPTPTQIAAQPPTAPTPRSENITRNIFHYIMCILRHGDGSCK